MEKLKFTQIFHESEEKTLADDEKKLKLIIDANPGKEDEIYDEFYDASGSNGLDAFFEKYKDALESKKDEPSEEPGEDKSDEDEYEQILDDVASDEQVSPSENVNNSIEPIKKSDLQKACEVLNISESDFAIFEKYRGYNTDNTPKPEVEVLFKTPDSWPVHVGDKIKDTDPIFKNIAYRNEFILWKWAVEIFEKNGYREMYSNLLDKFTGSTRNTEMKSKGKELNDAVNAIRAHIIGNKTKVFDYATNEEIEIPNTLIFYIYICVIPKLFKVAKSGMGTVHILSNKIHATLFRLAAGFTEEDDLYKDIILSSFNLFIGGMAGIRALYNDVFVGKTLTDNANANPLSIFDTGWLGNNAADIKNVYHRMNRSFEDVDDNIKPFTTKVVKKANGKGPIAFNGVNGKAMYYAGHSFTDDQIRDEYERGEIDDETYEFVKRDIGEARNRIREEDIEMSAFAYIASFVGSQFRNFLSEMVQAAASKLDLKEAIKVKYSSQQEIEDETDPAKKQKMLDDNKKWEAVYKTLYDKLNNGGLSMDAPVKGKDGDAGTIGDTIAAPDESKQNDLKISLPGEFDNIIDSVKLARKKADRDLDSGEDTNLIGRDLFSLLKLEQFLFAGFNWLGYTPVNAWNFTGGYQEKRPEKALMKIKDWCRLALVGSKYGTIGGKTDPHFGLGNTDIRDTKQNTLLDSLAEVRGHDGVWFMEKTPEGIKERQKLLKFLEEDYENNFKKLYDFVKTKTKFDSVKAFIDSLGLSGTLWEPSSIMPEDIRTPANLVYQYDKKGNPKVMLKNQDAQVVSNWVRTIFANNPNSKTFDPLVNPKNENFDANRPIVDKIRDVTGIDLYSYFKDGKVDNKGILAALEAWSKLTNNKFNVFSGTEDNLASLSDEKAAQDGIFFKGGSSIIQQNHVNPKDEPSYDKYSLTTTTSPELIRRGSGVTYHDSLELVNFFKEVFREASEKETPKKQRFTIN